MPKSFVYFGLLILALLSSSTLAASPQAVSNDQIAITGTVYYWTLEDVAADSFCEKTDDFKEFQGGKYLPLRNTYIESEYVRIGSDPNSYTHDNGYYYLKNSGLSEGSYDVNLEIRAKTIMNSRLTLLGSMDTVVSIFEDSLDVYAVNVESTAYSIHTGETFNLDVYIGGPKNNIIGSNNSGLEALTSFWLAQDLSIYFRKVVQLAPNASELPWDVYLKYPRSKSFYHPFGLPTKGHIELSSAELFPSQIMDSMGTCTTYNITSNWKLLQATSRHEYSHQIMDMVYGEMPADDTGSHAPNVCTNPQTAWVEGFAEFLPASILNWQTVEGVKDLSNLEFNYNPYMTEDSRGIINAPFNPLFPPQTGLGSIDWHYRIMQGCTQPEESEGEVAAVLWDIFDSAGWEYLPEKFQPGSLPSGTAVIPPATWQRPLRWYDRISDVYLEDFWKIFKDKPWNLVGNHTANTDSFWSKWLAEFKNDKVAIHGLKAILFNRGIDTQPKPEHAPSIKTISIDTATRKINLTISEGDAEDRDFLYVNVGYMKQLTDTKMDYYYTEDKPVSSLATNWQKGQLDISLDIPRGKLGRVNGVLLHDSMLVDYKSENISVVEKPFNLVCASRLSNTFATAVAIQGNFAYVTDMESGLYIYDISKPLEPVQLSLLRSDMNLNETPWGGAMDIVVDGSYAYIAAYSGALVVVDISDPANPELSGYVALGGDPRALAINAKKAYVVNGTGGMAIIDITYPNSVGQGQSLDTAGAFDITIHANEAYVAVDGGVQIFTLGVFPSLKGTMSVPGDAVTGVTVGENGLVYLATRNGSVQVYDISTWDPVYAILMGFMYQIPDPERAYPIQLANLVVGGLPGRVLLSGSSLYGAGGVYDVSQPELLYKLASLIGDEFALKGDVLYSAAGSDGLLVYSRSAAATADKCGLGGEETTNKYLKPAGIWQGNVNDMAFANQYGFLAAGKDGLIVVSVKDPAKISKTSVYTSGDAPDKLNTMGVDIDSNGSILYLPSMSGNLQILDIADPNNLKRLGLVDWNRYEKVGAWQDVASARKYVFVCAGTGGLRALDAREPSDPPWKGTFTTEISDCTDVAVSMPIVYALGFSSGLQVFELMGRDSNSMPEFFKSSSWTLPQGISGTNYSSLYIDETRKLMYVSSLWNGVTILDISNPYQPPLELASFDPGRAYGMAGSGNLLYVGDELVVHMIDVSDVRNPKKVAEQQLTDRYGLEISAQVLKVYDGYLYVATNQDTLQSYQILP